MLIFDTTTSDVNPSGPLNEPKGDGAKYLNCCYQHITIAITKISPLLLLGVGFMATSYKSLECLGKSTLVERIYKIEKLS